MGDVEPLSRMGCQLHRDLQTQLRARARPAQRPVSDSDAVLV